MAGVVEGVEEPTRQELRLDEETLYDKRLSLRVLGRPSGEVLSLFALALELRLRLWRRLVKKEGMSHLDPGGERRTAGYGLIRRSTQRNWSIRALSSLSKPD